MKLPDFQHSFFRFFIDFEKGRALSLSHKPPTRTNRVRVSLEAVCELRHRPTGRVTTYALSAACKAEQVGAPKNSLWLLPNADVIFLVSSDGRVGTLKSWHKTDPGVSRVPASLGMQPERQFFRAGENFDHVELDLRMVDATPIEDFPSVSKAIMGTDPIVSRIEYADGDFDVRIDQPVKTLNLAERDGLWQTDTGPILLPDLSPERLHQSTMEIEVFDLAYSAWHAPDWAEFIVRIPVDLGGGVSVNHYNQPRHIEPTRNFLLVTTQGNSAATHP